MRDADALLGSSIAALETVGFFSPAQCRDDLNRAFDEALTAAADFKITALIAVAALKSELKVPVRALASPPFLLLTTRTALTSGGPPGKQVV